MADVDIEFYELTKVTIPAPSKGKFRIVSAAVIDCSLCGAIIDGMGGPGSNGPICTRCARLIMTGQARGAIKWDDAK